MQKSGLIGLFILLAGVAFSQTAKTLTWETSLQKAFDEHPLQAQPELLRTASAVRLEKIETSRLPNLEWKAQASFQSEQVKFPFEMPGVPGVDLPLYRLQTYAEGAYALYDGGAREAQKSLETAQLAAQEQQVKVELEKVKPMVTQSYFQALLLRERKAILEQSRQILQAKAQRLEAGFKHGVVLESDLHKLTVEDLRLQSEIDQTEGQIEGALATLSQLLGEEIDASFTLAAPNLDAYDWNQPAPRPEFELFTQQKQAVLAGESLIEASARPKVAAFAQAGVGAPNPLNFFDEKLSPYGMIGVNFSWKITDWKQNDRDRQLLSLQSRIIDTQRENFNHQLEIQSQQYGSVAKSLESVIARDGQIVELQETILEQLSAQLDHGVITATDYIEQVNQTTLAKLNQEAHRLQLLQTKATYLILRGIF
jgi:outer membrane protein TolC